MLLCVTLRGDALASADTAFVYQYALVNTLRWAVNCATVLLAVDWARSACAASPVDRGFDASAVLVSSISFGLALTLPFSLGVAGEPQQQHQDANAAVVSGRGRSSDIKTQTQQQYQDANAAAVSGRGCSSSIRTQTQQYQDADAATAPGRKRSSGIRTHVQRRYIACSPHMRPWMP